MIDIGTKPPAPRTEEMERVRQTIYTIQDLTAERLTISCGFCHVVLHTANGWTKMKEHPVGTSALENWALTHSCFVPKLLAPDGSVVGSIYDLPRDARPEVPR